jgi:DNA-directed RNA polymerase specialized sigma24 family protein
MIRLRVEGFEVAEIATRTSRSKRSVERVLQQFRALLKGALDDVGGDQGGSGDDRV